MVEARYRESGDRRLVNIYCAVLDYIQDLSKRLDLPDRRFEKGEGMIRRRSKHARRIVEVVQLCIDKGFNAQTEWESQILITRKDRTCYPDLVIRCQGENLYGEVGGFGLDKVFSCYPNEQLIWISMEKQDWEDNILYFDRKTPFWTTLIEALYYFEKKARRFRIYERNKLLLQAERRKYNKKL